MASGILRQAKLGTTMNDDSCPKCKARHISRTKHGFAVCRVCDHQWVTDKSKFQDEFEFLESCRECWGTGTIYDVHKQPSKCNSCNGTGWIGLEIKD